MQRKHCLNFLFIALMLVSAGCATATPEPGTHVIPGSEPPINNTGGSTDSLLTDPDNPINVSVQLDTRFSQTALISTDGGQLSAEDAAGNRFTLDIPAGALTTDTEITMTPVSAIDGLPFTNGLVAAVQFQPDGLFLYEEAILTIESAQAIPVENQIHFGYLGDGRDLHLAIPGPDFSKIQIRVPHFSGFGVGNGIDTDRANLLLARAAEHEVRLQQEVANYIQLERIKQIFGDASESPWFDMSGRLDSYYNLVVRPRMLAAGSSCANGKLAIQTLIGHERTLQLLGATNSSHMGEFLGLLETVYKKCREEAIKECKEKVDPRILISFEVSYARQRQLMGSSEGFNLTTTMDEAIKICGSAFTVTGQYDVFTFSGVICNLEKTFTTKANGPMWETNLEFTPANSQSGTFIAKGAFSSGEITSTAEGSYTIGPASDGTYQLILESPFGTYNAPLITGDMPGGSVVLTLTPLDAQKCNGK